MEILSILTGAFVAGVDLGIKKYTEENVRDGEERRIWKGKGIYRKVHNNDLFKRGYVVDYLSLKTKNRKLSDITFNLSDLALFAGAVLTVWSSLFGKKR